MLTFTFLLSMLTGLLFGAIPALNALRTQPADVLRGTTRSMRGQASFLQQALVVVQAMLSVVLISVAGLLLRSLSNLQQQSFGVETEHLMVVEIDPIRNGYTRDRVPALISNLQQHLSVVPGVQRVALALSGPLAGGALNTTIYVHGQAQHSRGENSSSTDRVTPGFFQTVGEPLLRGRDFTEGDRQGTQPVTIVNQSFVRKFFRDDDPLGKTISLDPAGSGYAIVGVVADAKYNRVTDEVVPMYFRPALQPEAAGGEESILEDFAAAPGAILLRTSGPPALLEQEVRRAMREADPNLAIVALHPLRAQVATQLNQQRTVARLTGTFGLLALVLASIGLYGVTAYSVARRVPEIGLRMALGADRRGVLGLVLRGALLQTLAGLLLGVPLAPAGRVTTCNRNSSASAATTRSPSPRPALCSPSARSLRDSSPHAAPPTSTPCRHFALSSAELPAQRKTSLQNVFRKNASHAPEEKICK